MTWRRIGSFGSSGSIRLMKYGVMSTRNLSGADSPSRSSAVRLRTWATSSRSLTRWLSCQRQSFHFSSGTSAQGRAAIVPERLGRIAAVDVRPPGLGGGRSLGRDGRLDLLGVHDAGSPIGDTRSNA